MNITKLYEIFQKYPAVSIDSREVKPNSIFFSLRGENFNGNEFALKALESGCVYAVVDEIKYALDNRFILVNDALTILQELAKIHRRNLHIPVMAITGTNGKTTTKELINVVLRQKYKVLANKGNLNNHIGVPLTLLSMNRETEFGVVEMGANHKGEIFELCQIAQPNYGLITNIGKAHLEGFGSFKGVIKAKGELYNYLAENKAVVFVNTDNKVLNELLSGFDLKMITYGTSKSAYCYGEFIASNPFLELKWGLKDKPDNTRNNKINSKLVGNYNFENALAAICIGAYFCVSPEKIKIAMEQYKPKNNRSQLVKTLANTLVLDAYNANPTNMVTVIENFSKVDALNKILILGDMLELGNYSQNEHTKIVQLIKEKGFKDVYLIGNNFSEASKNTNYRSFKSVDNFNLWVSKNKIINSYILLKASRKIHLEKIIDYL